MEQTLIPLVLGRSIAIEQLLSIAILHRSCGTRRRPSENTSKVTYRVSRWDNRDSRAKTLCQGNSNCFSSASIIWNEKVNVFFEVSTIAIVTYLVITNRRWRSLEWDDFEILLFRTRWKSNKSALPCSPRNDRQEFHASLKLWINLMNSSFTGPVQHW